MDHSTIISATGVIFTVAFGIWAVHLAMKHRAPKLTLLPEIVLPLFNTIIRGFPELQLTIDGEPIGKSIILIRAFLLNTGRKDISRQMIEDNVQLRLPDNHKWIKPKIVSKSSDVQAEIQVIEDPIIAFDFGLIRPGEYIQFEVLVDMPRKPREERAKKMSESSELLNKIRLYHRIADTGPIERLELNPRPPKSAIVMSAMFMFMIIGWTWMSLGPANDLIFQPIWKIKNKYGENVHVVSDYLEGGKVRLKGVDTDYNEVISWEDFYNERGTTIRRKVSFAPLISMSIQHRFSHQ